jgi:hypothetical protein
LLVLLCMHQPTGVGQWDTERMKGLGRWCGRRGVTDER